jgi:hypothetical protein
MRTFPHDFSILKLRATLLYKNFDADHYYGSLNLKT